MKYLSLIVLGSLLAFSGITACSESGVGQSTETPPASNEQNTDNPNSNTNNNAGAGPQAVPDDLSGTNVAPPPEPPPSH